MSPQPEPIHAHALENIRFIRDAMARASEFTAIPGWGGVLMGITACATSAIAGAPAQSNRWLGIWLLEAVVAVTIAAVAMTIKARRSDVPLWSAAPTRRFALAYVPAIAAAIVLTWVFATRVID